MLNLSGDIAVFG